MKVILKDNWDFPLKKENILEIEGLTEEGRVKLSEQFNRYSDYQLVNVDTVTKWTKKVDYLDNPQKVWVYGTLKKGRSNNHHLSNNSLVRVDILEGYNLLDLGSFPGVTQTNESEDKVLCEVYGGITDFTNLDALEGEGSLYERIEIKENEWVYVFKNRFSKTFKLANKNEAGVYEW